MGDVFDTILKTIQSATHMVLRQRNPVIFEVMVQGKVGDLDDEIDDSEKAVIAFKTVGSSFKLKVPLNYSFEQVKDTVAKCFYLNVKYVRLILNRKEIDPTVLVSALIPLADTDVIELCICYSKEYEESFIYQLVQVCPAALASAFDEDYISTSKSQFDVRGGMPYERPLGWLKYGLEVSSKYSGPQDWLASDNRPGEWAVAFHGTKTPFVGNIAQAGLKPGARDAYGQGVYCTPRVATASEYADTSLVSCANGDKRYKFVFQARVNPKAIRKCSDIDPTAPSDYWLIENPDDIRVYAILVKEVS